MRRMNGGGIRPLVTVAAATAALLLPLSACGGDEQDTNSSSENTPKPDDKAESTPSPTSTPSPSMPPLPPEAKEESKEGAAAFGKYYIDLWRRSEQANFYEELIQYHAPDCGRSCDAMVPTVGGKYVEGGELKIGGTQGFERSEEGRWHASVVFTIEAGEFVYRTPGVEPKRLPRQSFVAQIKLKYKEGMWEVKRIGFDPAGRGSGSSSS